MLSSMNFKMTFITNKQKGNACSYFVMKMSNYSF